MGEDAEIFGRDLVRNLDTMVEPLSFTLVSDSISPQPLEVGINITNTMLGESSWRPRTLPKIILLKRGIRI